MYSFNHSVAIKVIHKKLTGKMFFRKDADNQFNPTLPGQLFARRWLNFPDGEKSVEQKKLMGVELPAKVSGASFFSAFKETSVFGLECSSELQGFHPLLIRTRWIIPIEHTHQVQVAATAGCRIF